MFVHDQPKTDIQKDEDSSRDEELDLGWNVITFRLPSSCYAFGFEELGSASFGTSGLMRIFSTLNKSQVEYNRLTFSAECFLMQCLLGPKLAEMYSNLPTFLAETRLRI